MKLIKLSKTVEKSFFYYEKASARWRKTITKDHPLGLWSLVYIAGHRANRYLKLRELLENNGGKFRDRPPLTKEKTK